MLSAPHDFVECRDRRTATPNFSESGQRNPGKAAEAMCIAPLLRTKPAHSSH